MPRESHAPHGDPDTAPRVHAQHVDVKPVEARGTHTRSLA